MFLILFLADVIANDFGQLDFVCGRCYCHVAIGFCNLDFVWQVLLNKHVYLPKMVPLKWVCKGVWVLQVSREVLWSWKDDREGTPWDHTYQLKLHMPALC